MSASEMPKWKAVFNSALRVPIWGHVSIAAAAAIEAGYEYIAWNGRVYSLKESHCHIVDTGFTTNDLDGYRRK